MPCYFFPVANGPNRYDWFTMKPRLNGRTIKWVGAIVGVMVLAALVTFGSTSIGSLNFTNTLLPNQEGDSEPEISIAANGAMGIVALSLGLGPNMQFGTNLWTGPFGATPTFQGIIDGALQQPGRTVFGGEDADVDFGSTGTLHMTTLIFLGNPTLIRGQLGVSAITCANAASGFNSSNCTAQIIDTTQTDRPWITSDGSHVWISYHDSGNSTLIHIQRSDDDGLTFHRVGDPIVGQGGATGNSTFDNDQGPIVADPFTHNIYDIYAAGQGGLQKAKTALLTPDYVLWPAGAPAISRDSLVPRLSATLNAYDVTPSFEREERLVAGDFAFERGWDIQQVRPRAGGDVTTHRQRVFLVLQRGDDGRWRFARGMSQPGPVA